MVERIRAVSEEAQTGLPTGWVLTELGGIAVLNPRTFDTPPAGDEEVSFVPMPAVQAETGSLDASKTRLGYGQQRLPSFSGRRRPLRQNYALHGKREGRPCHRGCFDLRDILAGL
jgi:hypothetical protein